jgi:predicted GH43/DUF377 family glycosyl hydrolase
MKRKIISMVKVCVVMAVIALLATNALGQTKWTKYEGNPVLDLGAPGEWDDYRVDGVPSVLYENGTYKMWYSGSDGSNLRIGYATSSDGITWTKHAGNPVLDLGAPGEWDDLHIENSFVLFEDGIYKMWYSGDDGSNLRIGYATSSDGITWTKYEGNPVLDLGASGEWDDSSVGGTPVLFEDGTYKMWYSGYDGYNWRIGYATSSDGITWTKYEGNPVLDLGASGEWDDTNILNPSVLFEEGIYKMWYSSYDGYNWRIGYATSTDGIVWTKCEGNPVLDLGELGDWDDVGPSDPSVLFEDGKYKMWYSGDDGSNYRIGYATSSATIAIRTDKLTYHKGDAMTVYADVVNIDRDVPDAVLALYLVAGFRVFPVKIIPFDMPADYEVHDWQVFTISSLPSLRFSNYAYLGVLASRSEGILDADIAIWTFSSSLSATEAARLRQVAEEYVSNLTVLGLEDTRTVDLRDIK